MPAQSKLPSTSSTGDHGAPDTLQDLGLDMSEVDLSDIPDGTCGACLQAFGSPDKDPCCQCVVVATCRKVCKQPCFEKWGSSCQDAPPNHVLLVASAKGDNKLLCLKCFYIKRGSFAKLKLGEFFCCASFGAHAERQATWRMIWPQAQLCRPCVSSVRPCHVSRVPFWFFHVLSVSKLGHL